MLHSRIHFSADTQGGADIHAAWCSCRSCQHHDPRASPRARRIIRVQAGILLAFVAALYGTAILCAPGIIAAFQVTLP